MNNKYDKIASLVGSRVKILINDCAIVGVSPDGIFYRTSHDIRDIRYLNALDIRNGNIVDLFTLYSDDAVEGLRQIVDYDMEFVRYELINTNSKGGTEVVGGETSHEEKISWLKYALSYRSPLHGCYLIQSGVVREIDYFKDNAFYFDNVNFVTSDIIAKYGAKFLLMYRWQKNFLKKIFGDKYDDLFVFVLDGGE